MAVIADLTKAEVSAQISDTTLKAWWDSADAYDASFGTAELMIKLGHAMYRAQVAKNAAADPAPAAGEALNAYAAPVTSTVTLDPTTGLQTFTQSITISGTSAVDSDATVPALV